MLVLANSVSSTGFDNLVVTMTSILQESFISNPSNQKNNKYMGIVVDAGILLKSWLMDIF